VDGALKARRETDLGVEHDGSARINQRSLAQPANRPSLGVDILRSMLDCFVTSWRDRAPRARARAVGGTADGRGYARAWGRACEER
jgi:hypothetical protein